MEVYEPPSTTLIFSESYMGLNADDNLEKCDLLLNETGDYTIKIVNKTAGQPRDYALAFEILAPMPADIRLDYIVDVSDLFDFTVQWLVTGTGLDADLLPDASQSVNLPDFTIFAEQWMEMPKCRQHHRGYNNRQ